MLVSWRQPQRSIPTVPSVGNNWLLNKTNLNE